MSVTPSKPVKVFQSVPFQRQDSSGEKTELGGDQPFHCSPGSACVPW